MSRYYITLKLYFAKLLISCTLATVQRLTRLASGTQRECRGWMLRGPWASPDCVFETVNRKADAEEEISSQTSLRISINLALLFWFSRAPFQCDRAPPWVYVNEIVRNSKAISNSHLQPLLVRRRARRVLLLTQAQVNLSEQSTHSKPLHGPARGFMKYSKRAENVLQSKQEEWMVQTVCYQLESKAPPLC